MHPPDQQTKFVLLRANGWSLGKISDKLNVPKSTVFHWDCERRAEIHLLKCMQVEKLQEKYAPSYEEELLHLSTYLARVEQALQKHSFEHMRPEFLLNTAIHLRARLNNLRTDISVNSAAQQTGLDPIPVGGCISRGEKPILAADFDFAVPDQDHSDSPSPLNGEKTSPRHDSTIDPMTVPANLPLPQGEGRGEGERTSIPPFDDKIPKPILLPFPQPESAGEGGVPIQTAIPVPALAASAPLTAPSLAQNANRQNGTFSHENGGGSKLDASPSATSNAPNGTTVPFSHSRQTPVAPPESAASEDSSGRVLLPLPSTGRGPG